MSVERKMKKGKQGSFLIIVRTLMVVVYDSLCGLCHLSFYYILVFGRPGEVVVFIDLDSLDHLVFFVSIGLIWCNEFAFRFFFWNVVISIGHC